MKVDTFNPEIWKEIQEKHNINIHNDFADLCIDGEVEEVKKWISSEKIDLLYEDGLFAVYASGNKELLKVLYEACPKLKKYNLKILSEAADNGKLECVKYLIEEQNADYKLLKGTTSYSNYSEIENYFNGLEKNEALNKKSTTLKDIKPLFQYNFDDSKKNEELLKLLTKSVDLQDLQKIFNNDSEALGNSTNQEITE